MKARTNVHFLLDVTAVVAAVASCNSTSAALFTDPFGCMVSGPITILKLKVLSDHRRKFTTYSATFEPKLCFIFESCKIKFGKISNYSFLVMTTTVSVGARRECEPSAFRNRHRLPIQETLITCVGFTAPICRYLDHFPRPASLAAPSPLCH